ncbi:hypothetical protein SynBIOSE41_02383 [Synechococcus sp. BIOS-E4-1]|nr:hypothetical protein SynBIOSE41_02383 [Synechococcus sp. BIOS-E4-1]
MQHNASAFSHSILIRHAEREQLFVSVALPLLLELVSPLNQPSRSTVDLRFRNYSMTWF